MSDDEDLKTPGDPRSVSPNFDAAGVDPEDDWDAFDFDSWGAEGGRDVADGGRNETALGGVRDTEIDLPDIEGEWVSQGGILHWEESGAEQFDKPGDARSEAKSHWASDSIDLPPGAPDYLRLRSLRAWLLRQRMLETEALGELLLERRQREAGHEQTDDSPSPSEVVEDSPLELELTKRQASIEVYEALVESLDELATHSGPARILVEYYLWLSERLAFLVATAPAALNAPSSTIVAPLDPLAEGTSTADARQSGSSGDTRSIAEWQGRMHAALQARRRIEQVSTPEPED